MLRGSNQLAFISATTDTVFNTVATGLSPRQVCRSETSPSSRLYVVNFGSNVTVFDASGTSSLAVGTGPGSCRVLRNQIYVANDVGGGVSVIDSNVNDVIETLPTGAGPTMLAAELELVVVGNTGSGSVSIFPEAVSTPAFTISTGADPRTAFIDAEAQALYVVNRGSNTVSVIDLYEYVVKQQVPVGVTPHGITRYASNYFVTNQNNGGAGTLSVYKRFDFRNRWDLGADGRSDLLWRNASTGRLAAWQMSGVSTLASALLPDVGGWMPTLRASNLGVDQGIDLLLRNPARRRRFAKNGRCRDCLLVSAR